MAMAHAASARRLRRRISTSLGAKLVVILTAIGLLGAGAVTLLLALVIIPSFDRLEQAGIRGHAERSQVAIDGFAARMRTTVREYADCDDSYAEMGRLVGAFDGKLTPAAMRNLGVGGLAYVMPTGRIATARWLDLHSGKDQPAMRARLLAAVGQMDFRKVLVKRSSAGFYLRLGDRIVAVGVAQVRRADGSGPPRGHVVAARLIDTQLLSDLLQVDAKVDPSHAIPGAIIASKDRRTGVALPFRGLDGAPVGSVTYDAPRELSALGRSTLTLAVFGTILLLLVVMAVMRWMVVRLVLRPLNRIEQHMRLVRTSGNLAPLTAMPRQDEIGRLVSSFNAMVGQLKNLSEQVEAQSFRLGQSESAVAVMHNVRNALNPISTVLSQGLGQAPLADRTLLNRAIAELAGEAIPIARRQKLAAFLAATVEGEAQSRATRQERLRICRDALHNVMEIIGRQQEQAHERAPLDTCDVTEIVARNATIARYSGGSSIAFHFPSRPHWVLANRVLLSQVIGNLFTNAAEAIAATGREGGSIAVTIHDRGDQVEVLIRDDGEGFDPKSEPKLFQRGFSTRVDKSGGLGLHWCANSMLAMGGSLSLNSAGKGQGARAVLCLQASHSMRQDAAA